MEVPKTLQENIRKVQNQLKLAIQNHQVILLKHKSNNSSGNLKLQLWKIQQHIISLGETQKYLVQQLRKELEANATNCTLGPEPAPVPAPAPARSPAGPSPSPPLELPPPNHGQPAPNGVSSSPSRHVDSQREQKCVVQADAGSPTCKVEPCTPAASPERELHIVVEAAPATVKQDFMTSLGLVTHEALFELRNRRVERKRRSTANHFQFIYGTTWDTCKRKKGNYLVKNGVGKLPPARVLRGSSPPEEKCSPLAPALRFTSLPESLTIQRITSSEPLCVVCRKTDNVQVCGKCSNSYHMTCVSDGDCPRCCKSGSSPTTTTNTTSTTPPTISEKMKQKLELLMKSNALCVEKSSLEQRRAQLASAIQEQEVARAELLHQQEETSVSIQRVRTFVHAYHTAPC